MTFAELFAKRLRILLAQNDFKHKEFAEKCNISYNTLRSYLDSKSRVSVENAIAMANTLGVTLDYLLLGEKSEKSESSDITPQGIFDAINYLISALGEEIVHAISRKHNCLVFQNEIISTYLDKIRLIKDIKDEKDRQTILSIFADVENLIYNEECKTLSRKDNL